MTAARFKLQRKAPARRLTRHACAIAAGLTCGLLLPAGPAQALNVVWGGGAGSWTNSSGWVGNLYPNSSADSVYIDGLNLLNSAVTLDTALTVGRIFIDSGDSLAMTGGGTLGLAGSTLSNNGTLTLAANSSAWARMTVGSALTLSGNGTTVLASDANSGYRAAVSGGPLTIASGHTVRGAGDLGSTTFGAMSLVNQGTVVAEGGSMRTYQTGSQTFNNAAGLVQIADGAAFVADGKFSGGTVQSLATGAGTGLIGGGVYSNVALRGPLEVQSNLALNGGTLHDSLLVRQATLNATGSITNNGTLTFAATAVGGSRMAIGSAAVLSGNGTTVLASDTNSGYRAAVSGGQLTIGSGHTVRGHGDLGSTTYGSTAVINQGTVIVEGGALNTYQTSGQSFDNTAGLVQIANDARLVVNGSLSGGTIQGLGLNSTLSGSTLNSVTLAGTLALPAGPSLSVRGTLTSNGSLSLAASNSGHSRLILAADSTLAGSGITRLSSDINSGYRAVINGSGVLTIAAGHTVHGAGDLGSTTFGSMAVINRGTVFAQGGTLNTYQTGSQTFDNATGLVQIAEEASVVVNGKFSGGTVQSLATGAATALLGGSTFHDVALRGPLSVLSTLSLNGGSIQDSLLVRQATLYATGNLTNNGTVTLQATAAGWSRLAIGTAATLAGSGATLLASDTNSGYRAAVSGGQLTIGSGHTVHGHGDLGSTTFGSTAVINQGTVIAEGGTLNTYQTGSQSFDNTAGLLQIANDARLVANGGFSGGTIQGLGLNSTLSGSTFNNVTLAGTLAVSPGDSLQVGGTLTSNGSLSLAASNSGHSRLILAADTTLAGSGNTRLSSDINSGYRAVINGSGVLTIAAGHTVRGAGDLGSTTFGSMAVINQGTVIAEDGTLNTYQTGSQSFDNRNGTLRLDESGAAIINGQLLLADSSVLSFDVAAPLAGSPRVGLLSLRSGTTFDGTLQLNFEGYTPTLGEQFRVIDFSGSYTGAFDAAISNGYTLSLSYANTEVVATITGVSAVPEPQTWALLLGGLAWLAWARRSAAPRR